jgi:hypothetical protein
VRDGELVLVKNVTRQRRVPFPGRSDLGSETQVAALGDEALLIEAAGNSAAAFNELEDVRVVGTFDQLPLQSFLLFCV